MTADNGSSGHAPDLVEARRFLQLLDPSTERFTFQTFQDLAPGIKVTQPHLARVISGTIDDALLLHNYKYGSGIWVTINRTGLRGRKAADIVAIRAVWQEDDNGYAGAFPLEPSIVVESSPEHFHRYWLTSGWPADDRGRADHGSAMERMIASYGSDKGAKDISRVLRVPGFLHRKNPDQPFMVRIVAAPGHRYSRAEILEAFPPVPRPAPKPRGKSAVTDGNHTFSPGARRDDDVVDADIAEALAAIPADDRDIWLEIGMALHAHLGDCGRAIWDDWSSSSAKYDELGQDKAWRSFGKRHGITIRTLFHHAMRSGWVPPGVREKPAWSAAGRAISMFPVDEAWGTFAAWCEQHPELPLPRTRREFIFNSILEKELANGH